MVFLLLVKDGGRNVYKLKHVFALAVNFEGVLLDLNVAGARKRVFGYQPKN